MRVQEVVSPPFQIAWQTDVGIRRRGRPNEDRVEVWLPPEPGKPPLLIVADGMGGHRGGALASQLVVQHFLSCYQELPSSTDWREGLMSCVYTAHRAVRDAARQRHFPSMGSTVVAAVLLPDRVIGVNVGDSRAYLFHDGELKQLSRDHSVAAELLRRGELTPEEAHIHPTRNRLIQSISAQRDQIFPHVFEVPWQPGNQLLLCSDGLWGVVPERRIAEVLQTQPPGHAVARLIQLANQMEGPDNISAIVAAYTDR